MSDNKPLQAGSYGGEPVAGYGLHGIRNQGMYDNSQNNAFLTRDDVTQDAFWPAMDEPDLQPQGITVADYLLKGRLYMLADGVTACADGYEASRLALKTVGAAFYAVEALPEDTAADRAERLRDAVWEAHNVLLNWQEKLACWRHGHSIKIYGWGDLTPIDQERHACPLCQKTMIGLQCAIAAVVLRGSYASYVSCGDDQILYIPADPNAPIEQLNRPEKLFLGTPGLAIGQLQMGQRKLLPGDKLVLLGDGIVDMLGYGRNKADWHAELRQRLQAPLKHQDGKQDEAYEQFPRLVRTLVEQIHETATRLHAQTDLGDDMSIYALGYPDKAQLETYISQGKSDSPNPDQLARYLHYIDDSAAYNKWRQLDSQPRLSTGAREKTKIRVIVPPIIKPRQEIIDKKEYFEKNPTLLTKSIRTMWAKHCSDYLETIPDDAEIKEAWEFFRVKEHHRDHLPFFTLLNAYRSLAVEEETSDGKQIYAVMQAEGLERDWEPALKSGNRLRKWAKLAEEVNLTFLVKNEVTINDLQEVHDAIRLPSVENDIVKHLPNVRDWLWATLDKFIYGLKVAVDKFDEPERREILAKYQKWRDVLMSKDIYISPPDLAKAVESLRDAIFASKPDTETIATKITDLLNALLATNSGAHHFISKASWTSEKMGKAIKIVSAAQRQTGRQQDWYSLDEIVEIANAAEQINILYTHAEEITPNTTRSVVSWIGELQTYDDRLKDFDKFPPYYRQAHSAARYLFFCSQYAQAKKWTDLAQHLSDNSQSFAMATDLLADTVRRKKGDYARYLLEQALRATTTELLGGLYKALANLSTLDKETNVAKEALYEACQIRSQRVSTSKPLFQLVKAARQFYRLSLPGSLSAPAQQGWHTHKQYFVNHAWQAFTTELEDEQLDPQQLNDVSNELAELQTVSVSGPDADDRRLLVMKHLSQMWRVNNPEAPNYQQNVPLRTAQSIRAIEDALNQLANLDKDPHKERLQKKLKANQEKLYKELAQTLLEKIQQHAISDKILTSIAESLAGKQYPLTYQSGSVEIQVDARTPEVVVIATLVQLFAYYLKTKNKDVQKSIISSTSNCLDRSQMVKKNKERFDSWSGLSIIVIELQAEEQKADNTLSRLFNRFSRKKEDKHEKENRSA